MFRREEIEKIRKADEERLAKVKRSAEDIATQRADQIHKKGQDYQNRVQELIDKKNKVFSAPLTKIEVLAMLKDALQKGKRKWFLENILIPHAKNVQIQRGNPLNDADLRVYLFNPENLWKCSFAFISEKDLEEACEALPEGVGLSSSERDAQIKKLDQEIADLEAQIEKELKKA